MSDRIREGLDIAVVGLSGRFPGARTIDEYWSNLVEGKETIAFFEDQELIDAGVDPELLQNPQYVKAKGVLEGVEYFDAGFFNLTPGEATVMDPQIRIFMQIAWHALEDAGYAPETCEGLIGVYAGASNSVYWEMLSFLDESSGSLGSFATALQNNKDFITTQTSFRMNLQGPSFSVATACSTSLVAIHEACKGLLSGDCDIAIAGGSSVSLPQKQGYLYQKGSLLSEDGHCRAFDADASGIIFGNGAGAVVLKRVEDAISDGDQIYAVIKGSAINNDGRRKIGYTAPSVEGQAEVIRTALQLAEVSPETIRFIETHGTGTAIGDPIEFEGLKAAFNSQRRGFCKIGSVKTNIGHLDAAAGVAGFIKSVLALKHKQLPPSLNFKTANPKIDFDNSPFQVNTSLLSLTGGREPLRAGVSSFGVGGTNAHIVLEEAPPVKESSVSRDWSMIMLSARTPTALQQMKGNLADSLRSRPDANVADVAYTLQTGRQSFAHKSAFVCRDIEEAVRMLEEGKGVDIQSDKAPFLTFMFPGQGSQYIDMAKDLYEHEPVFREELDACFRILNIRLQADIKRVLFPQEGDSGQEALLNKTEFAQPIIFSLEYALAKLLIHWGIKPNAMIGYSFGDYVAACLAGVFRLEDALQLVAVRGQLMSRLPEGAMLSVPLPEAELLAHKMAFAALQPQHAAALSLAIDNGQSCIVSGTNEGISAFELYMKSSRVMCMRVSLSFAAHSLEMHSIRGEFEKAVRSITLKPPAIPFLSNVTGDWISPEQAADPLYWVEHMQATVRFAKGIEEIVKRHDSLFVEIGPGRDLSVLIRRFVGDRQERIVNTLRHPSRELSDVSYLCARIAQLWSLGVPIAWDRYYEGEERRKVSLAGYPFEEQKYWIDGDPFLLMAQTAKSEAGILKKESEIAQWFYQPSWTNAAAPLTADRATAPRNYVLFMDGLQFGDKLAVLLEQRGSHVIKIREGASFAQQSDSEYSINPGSKKDYDTLLRTIASSGRQIDRIVHLWGVTPASETANRLDEVKRAQTLGYYSLLFIAQTIRKLAIMNPISIHAVTSHLFDISGHESLSPAKATILGPCRVIPQELPNVSCQLIEVELPRHNRQEQSLLERLADETDASSGDPVISLRGSHRWRQIFEPVRIEKSPHQRLKQEGIYLITGGLGGIGLILAEHLARTVHARLALISRKSLPPREQWDDWLASHDDVDATSAILLKIRKMEEAGGAVLVIAADVSDTAMMKRAIEQTEAAFGGAVNGVVHAAGRVRCKSAQSPIDEINEAESEDQFQPKMYGLLALEEALQGRELDFCLLVSSLAPVLGGLGFVAYSAANSYMDAFANYYNRKDANRWVTVNWGDWRYDGGVETSLRIGESLKKLDMSPEEGVETFDRILGFYQTNQIIVSSGDLQMRLKQWVQLETLRDTGEEQGAAPFYPRPELDIPYVAPGNELETRMADIWRRLFKFERVGIKDDFFELGGDSLKAITVVAKIHKELNAEIPLIRFFEQPTIEKLAAYVQQAGESEYAGIAKAEEKAYYPLSFSQRRLYIIHHISPHSTSYNDSIFVGLEGKTDVERVEQAIKKLIHRHETLRTSFHTVEGQVYQRVSEQVDFSLAFMSVSEPEAREAIEGFVRPFDLGRAPLLRAGLIRTAEDRHVLMIDMHHIVTDGVSQEILVSDFISFYDGKPLSDLPVQYRDYAEWLHSDARKETIRKHESYWLERFQGHAGSTQLPTDFPRPDMRSDAGELVAFELDEAITARIKDFLPRHDVTLFIFLLAGYQILLSKYSNQEDIVVGSPISGRDHPDLSRLIGVFVNMLAMRNFPAHDKTAAQFVSEVKANALQAYENHSYPFEQLVSRLGVQGELNRNPLFDTIFLLQNMESESLDMKDLRIVPYPYEHPRAQVDILVRAKEDGRRIRIAVEYSTDLYRKETLLRLSQDYVSVLEQVLDNPAVLIKDIRAAAPGRLVPESNPVLKEIGDFIF